MPKKVGATDQDTLFGWSKVSIYASSLVLIFVITIAAVSFFVGKNQSTKTASPIPVIDVSARNPQVLGAQMFNWNGTVVDVMAAESALMLDVSYRANDGSRQEKQITVTVDDTSQLLRWDVTAPTTSVDTGSRTPMALSDVIPGQQVAVQSSMDVAQHDTITAGMINVLITPQ